MIQEELAASLEYKKLAAQTSGAHRRAFMEMSKDEKKHANMLSKMLR